MRTTLLTILFASAFVIGCSSGSYRPPLHLDMGSPTGDMAGKVFDLSMGTCNAPKQICNGVCTDTATDSQNCGFCGNQCTGGQFCQASSCTGGNMPDLAMQGGAANCGQDITCINACADQTCFMNCQNMSNPNSWNLLLSLIDCVFGGQGGNPPGACPTTTGGICDSAINPPTQACSDCIAMAQSQGGACDAETQACGNDP
jgi:hypothetical protein